MRAQVSAFLGLSLVLTVGCAESEAPSAEPIAVMTVVPRGALGFLDVSNSAVSPWCAAVLVASDVVITAARCVADLGPSQLRFGVGSVTAEGAEGGLYPVRRIVMHPDHNEWQHDLAALILDHPVLNATPAPMTDDAAIADGSVDSVTYRFVRRGEVSPRNFWSGAGHAEDSAITVVPETGSPNCQCVVGGGALDAGGRLLGMVSTGTGNSKDSPSAPYCAGVFKLAAVAHNLPFMRQAVALSVVPQVP
jgi:hypothetical protein